jgi:hypothetical protein
MHNTIYSDNISPDYNYGIWGRLERLSANRFIICLMTEYGLMNNKRMQAHQINKLIINIQPTAILKL